MANSVSKWLLTVPEVMEILGIGRTFTYSLINRGDLESIKVGKCRRIPMTSVEHLVESLRNQEDNQTCESSD